ncbi:MAG: type II secretion system F family protein [Chthoniobacter sp.]|uniref:type II secretion system F family protein n=1 Tax=Chthoniobacter sp. TaxID=2510640 RepID=UPI0032A1EC47
MPEFFYRARSYDGQVIDGSVTTASRASAIAMVEALGAVPISIKSDAPAVAPRPGTSPASKPAAATTSKAPAKVGTSTRPAPSSPPEIASATITARDRLSFNHQHLFTEQLAHLLGAGLTLDESLKILGQRLRQPRLRGLSQTLHRALIDGRSLSQALGEFPRIFPPLYVNLVSAGEASGALPKILLRLTEHLSALQALRDKVRGALLYPSVLVVAGLGLILTFMTVMMPQLTGFFKGTGQPLPPATQMLINANAAIAHYWWAAPLGAMAAFAAHRAFTQSVEGRLSWDALVWRIPVVSRITRYRFFVQFAQTLGTLCDNGLTMLRALELLEEISGNAWVKARTLAARQAVIDGAALSAALREQQLFPDLFLDMLSVGEQTGRLGETMHHIADVYERELNKQVTVVSTLIPPLVMIGIAGIIGTVVYGIMSAVFGLTQNLHVQH